MALALNESIHVGDGAYITAVLGGVVVTANHVHPALATDKVYIDTFDIPTVIEVLQGIIGENETDETS